MIKRVWGIPRRTVYWNIKGRGRPYSRKKEDFSWFTVKAQKEPKRKFLAGFEIKSGKWQIHMLNTYWDMMMVALWWGTFMQQYYDPNKYDKPRNMSDDNWQRVKYMWTVVNNELIKMGAKPVKLHDTTEVSASARLHDAPIRYRKRVQAYGPAKEPTRATSQPAAERAGYDYKDEVDRIPDGYLSDGKPDDEVL